MSYEAITYNTTTDTPGNDTNDYTFYNSVTSHAPITAYAMAQLGIVRVSLALYTTQAGTIKVYFRGAKSTTWYQMEANISVAAMTAATQIRRDDWYVGDVDEFRVIWTHGGTEIGSSGVFLPMVHLHRDRSVST